jgi:predicted ATPase
MPHLIKANLRTLPETKSFPFSLPLLQTLKEICFDSPVTLFVGENGSGKSTLLEALACAAEMIVVGSESTRTDQSLIHARELAKFIKLSWTKHTRRGFFLRAEDFFGYSRRLNQMRNEMESDLRDIDQEYLERSDYARGLAKMSYARELGDMHQRYGEGWMPVRTARVLWHYSNPASCQMVYTFSTSLKHRFHPSDNWLLLRPSRRWSHKMVSLS